MAKVIFQELDFQKTEKGVEVTLYNLFRFAISKEELQRIGKHRVGEHFIDFPGINEATARRRLMLVMGKEIQDLRNRMTGNSATYIHENSGIPLVGSISFGIVDRGTTLLEIKPVTSCNLNCVYCSVGEGLHSKMHDFVVQWEYLVNELRRIIEIKGNRNIEIHIGCQGEPLLYAHLTELVEGCSALPNVATISMDTNGVLLTKARIDALYSAGMNQFNISLNSLDSGLASKISGVSYPLRHVIEIAEYISKKGARLVIAPVWVPGVNDTEIPKLIEFGKRLKATVGIQKFLEYRHGRKPVRQSTWDRFYTQLRLLEKRYCIKLKLYPEDFNIRPAKSLPKPFKKGEIVKARIVCLGRYSNEAIVSARGRSITVITKRIKGIVRFKILRTKHNIYLGKSL